MPNDTSTDSWDPEDSIDAENISTEIPDESRDGLLWQAIKAAINVSDTKKDVLRKVKLWNTYNDPQLSETELFQKTTWALRKWDSKFRSTH